MDPSVEFGLRFETSDEEDNTEEPAISNPDEDNRDKIKKATGEIVSLDSFRK